MWEAEESSWHYLFYIWGNWGPEREMSCPGSASQLGWICNWNIGLLTLRLCYLWFFFLRKIHVEKVFKYLRAERKVLKGQVNVQSVPSHRTSWKHTKPPAHFNLRDVLTHIKENKMEIFHPQGGKLPGLPRISP